MAVLDSATFSTSHIFMPHHLIEELDIYQKQARTFERHQSTLVEHAAILDALRSRDTDRVQAAVRTHVDSSLKALFISSEDAF